MNPLKYTVIIGLFVLVGFTSGCSSIAARTQNENPAPYAGTKSAMKNVKKSWYDYDIYGQVYLYIIDTPFSFIADTFLYPLDAYQFGKNTQGVPGAGKPDSCAACYLSSPEKR